MLVLGSRLDVRQTPPARPFRAGSRIVRVEAGRGRARHSRVRSDIALRGDVRQALLALLARRGGRGPTWVSGIPGSPPGASVPLRWDEGGR